MPYSGGIPLAEHVPPPPSLPGFPGVWQIRSKTRVAGAGLRRRWTDGKRLYEWDSQHGTVEAYNLRGEHQGEFDPRTGKILNGPDRTRTVEP
ncbi:colicin E3/pyocin S6 family cytotoxin [Nitrospirillum sp. BR 11164]|uniref:colicin E3/pyocin S6 family cytotoxin n=1 Tax=Nitrospirillum sp. BR 11164 TaxID=3104324 RepID=UPI003A4C7F44